VARVATAAHQPAQKGTIVSLESGALQTPVTDFKVPGILDGEVKSMDVLDPTEKNEKTALLEEDDEFAVRLIWQLSGAATTVVGGYWVVSLYSKNMDAVGPMQGLISGPAVIPIHGAAGPLTFEHTFRVRPPKPRQGLYKLTATINHSPTGDPKKVSEMFGFAESTPIDIRESVIEVEAAKD
jgi:hypothetical protein